MRITSREAHPDDVAFLADCFLRSMRACITLCRGEWDEARERAQFERQLDLRATKVIRADDVDVGFVMCVQQPTALQMHTLCIAPEHQGRGIGSHITVDVINRGRQAGHDVVLSVLKANTRAERLFQRFGFTVVEESEYHLHMKQSSRSQTPVSSEVTPHIPGAAQIEKWWGRWIDFHDFYLLTVPLPGATEGLLRIHGWVTDWNSTDERGYFRQSGDCVVTLLLGRIHSISLSEGTLPAIITELTFEPTSRGWFIHWNSSFGTDGRLEAADVSMSLEPGKPQAR